MPLHACECCTLQYVYAHVGAVCIINVPNQSRFLNKLRILNELQSRVNIKHSYSVNNSCFYFIFITKPHILLDF